MVQHIISESKRQVTVILTNPQGRIFIFKEEELPDYLDYDGLVKSLKEGLTEEAFIVLIDEIEKFLEKGKGKVSYNEEKDTLVIQEIELPEAFKRRYASMIKAGEDVTPLDNFITKMKENPTKNIQEELFAFMIQNDLPLTKDGDFLAYKYVSSKYLDKYSATIDNSVGKIVEMERGKVDSNRFNTCSRGLHFTSKNYAFSNSYEDDRIVVLKINPKDVMAIPPDYNEQKGRCCRYEVIDEINKSSEEIVKDFVKDKVKETATVTVTKEKKATPLKVVTKKISGASFLDNTGTFDTTEYTLGKKSFKAYVLCKIPPGSDWKEALDQAKKDNIELQRFFTESTSINRINKGRETSDKERLICAVVSETQEGLTKIVDKPKIVLRLV